MDDKYTLRYSGGLVPDIYQQFTKNQGVFANPTPTRRREAALGLRGRALRVAGGEGGREDVRRLTGGSILDVEITAVDQRTALCIGSRSEVDRFNEPSGATTTAATRRSRRCFWYRPSYRGVAATACRHGSHFHCPSRSAAAARRTHGARRGVQLDAAPITPRDASHAAPPHPPAPFGSLARALSVSRPS